MSQINEATAEASCNRNGEEDRRTSLFRSAMLSIYKRRRIGSQRRDKDQANPHYVDIHEPWLFYMAIAALLFSVFDCFFTLLLLKNGSEELNPFMDILIQKGEMLFFAVKFLVTTFCLCFLVIHKHFKLFNIISGYQILIACFIFYAVLITYEINMLVALVANGYL